MSAYLEDSMTTLPAAQTIDRVWLTLYRFICVADRWTCPRNRASW